jgi:hypothetical protein
MGLRCGNEAGDSANFGAQGSLRGTEKETNCFALLYKLETPKEDWGVRFICLPDLRTFRIMNGFRPSQLDHLPALDFLHRVKTSAKPLGCEAKSHGFEHQKRESAGRLSWAIG